MLRGYSSSPLAIDDRLIVPVGGKGRGIMALDQQTGDVLWSSGDFDRGFSSPALIEVDGQRQIVLLNREEILAVDPSIGERLWTWAHPIRFGLSITVPTFYPEDNLLFVSTAYDGGTRVLRLGLRDGRAQVEELWSNLRMRIHIGNAIRVGDVAWGANGDFGPVPFTGVDIHSGEIVHRTREVARAYQVLAGSKLVLLDEDGLLALATPRSDGLEIHAKAQIFKTRSWTPPTVVGRTLLARDQAEVVSLRLP